MPSRTKDHYLPAPVSKAKDRKLISRWVEYGADNYGYSQQKSIEIMNAHFKTSMRPWQLIRWRSPTTKADEERAIHIDVVEYMAKNGGIAQIFKANNISEDPKLLNELATIWYHPQALIQASIKAVVEQRMSDQVKDEKGVNQAAKAVVSTHAYVAQHLDIILECLSVEFNKKGLSEKKKAAVANEIYSIVGFDFSPSR